MMVVTVRLLVFLDAWLKGWTATGCDGFEFWGSRMQVSEDNYGGSSDSFQH